MDQGAALSRSAFFLFDQIRDAHPKAQEFAYYLEYLVFHLPEARLEPALRWLVKNKLTGERFLRFVKFECKNSALELLRHLTMRLEKETKLRVITRGDLR